MIYFSQMSPIQAVGGLLRLGDDPKIRLECLPAIRVRTVALFAAVRPSEVVPASAGSMS
jgi:hypothetical protein